MTYLPRVSKTLFNEPYSASIRLTINWKSEQNSYLKIDYTMCTVNL